MISIGIDTGGTCTDAVIFDTVKKEVLSYGKTLTTKKDLKTGIMKALGFLDKELIKKAEYLALSTTLATNACVEGKGGRAKLVFIGVNKNIVEKMQGEYGLPPVPEIYFLNGNAAHAEEGEMPDWEKFRADVKAEFGVYDSIAVVQMNAKYNDGVWEKDAEAIIKEETGLPVVRGYDLYQELNVQKRGATALLNARLITVMNDFFDSIDRSLEELGIDIPIVVVKSDGSVMSKDYAMNRPVETLLCGPAASIIGAMELSSRKDALIVDIGGTTSDIAMLKDRVPVSAAGGITVGSWKTMVKGVSIDTFALGGDSAVEYEDNYIYLDNRRIVPLCMAAAQYPEVETKLRALVDDYKSYSYPANQFLMLMNSPENMEKYTPNEQALINALADGPLMFHEAAEACGISPYIFKFKRLEDEGVVIRCGVTPTDVMHIYGEYTDYNVEASRLGVLYLQIVTKRPFEELCTEIYDLAKKRLYCNLAAIFMKHETGRELSEDQRKALDQMTAFMFDHKKKGGEFTFMEPAFNSKISLIGIGAPTRIFLADVAELFGTDADVPEYAKVANAIGAAVGTVISEYVVRISKSTSQEHFGLYRITGGEEFQYFEAYEDAIEEAKAIAGRRAKEKALAEGAKTELKVDIQVEEDFYALTTEDSKLFLGAEVIARAMAK